MYLFHVQNVSPIYQHFSNWLIKMVSAINRETSTVSEDRHFQFPWGFERVEGQIHFNKWIISASSHLSSLTLLRPVSWRIWGTSRGGGRQERSAGWFRPRAGRTRTSWWGSKWIMSPANGERKPLIVGAIIHLWKQPKRIHKRAASMYMNVCHVQIGW